MFSKLRNLLESKPHSQNVASSGTAQASDQPEAVKPQAASAPDGVEQIEKALSEREAANIAALEARAFLKPGFTPGMRKGTDPELVELRNAHAYHGPVLAKVPGVKEFWMYSQNDDNVSLNFFYCGEGAYETLSTVVFGLLSRGAKNVMDLGGHTGLFSLIAASAEPAVQVHYFEIMPLIAKRGQINARISGLSSRIKVNNIGLSRAEGKMEVHFNERWPLWTGASLEAIKERVNLKGAQTLEVSVTTLDNYWESNGRFPCSLAKLDVEGHEQAVFEGGADFLRENKPVLMCEILSLENLVDFRETLKSLGYNRIYEIDDRSYRIRELGPDLAYGDGKPYEFSEYHNVLFCAEPLPADLSQLVERELSAAGISPPQEASGIVPEIAD